MVVGVIFDIDGTLVTFRFDVQGTRLALFDELRRHGLGTQGLDLRSATQTILDSAREQSDAGLGPGYETIRESVFAILDGFEVQSAASASIIPGALDVVDGLRSRGVRLGVLTNSGRKAAEATLRRAGLMDRFEFVLTRDETRIMKPRPEGMEMAAAKLGLPKGSIFYVGDSAQDVHAAISAGIKVVSVATGNYTAERLSAEGADFVVSGLSELGAILGI
ncbi:MAG: HAD family hydrolase [Nitrososphaerota archaeon]|nr:HAD family hydrolase [Nitrososphaerota archaeon]MDG6990501.1 HAD family hydrolase [Nitrososphaerota archaeon]